MSEPEDTDTLLALLASLLPDNAVPSQQVLLETLLQTDCNIEAAADAIRRQQRTEKQRSTGTKRKRDVNLDSWLTRAGPSKVVEESPSRSPAKRSSLDGQSRSSPNKKPRSENNALFRRGDSPSLSRPVKQVKNLLDVLRPPPSAPSSVPRPPPLTLSNPSLVAQHTPCTLHLSVLPPELASRLFYIMLHEARDWSRNRWWLFDRMVESPHRSSLYTRHPVESSDEAAWQGITRAWYNGRKDDTPTKFPTPMEEACQIIEKTVNEEMRKRSRYALEWGGDPGDPTGEGCIWRANFAAANCYEGAKETVGFHSDRLTTIGPYPTIASLSLGTRRTFRLREVITLDEADKRAAQTFNIILPHNSLCIMHASTQERFKHSIPPQATIDRFHPSHSPPPDLPELTVDPGNCRINITFRFFRPDFHPDSIPRCKCGEMTTLRPDMKGRQRSATGNDKGKSPESSGAGVSDYWWTCTAGDQNEGKGCGFWKVMDVKAEGRGPFASDV
ncbi:hypothetical protein BC834DRAFT_816404 [Gloeopeniophorella convolvens]|nr:hypothetical protein BC834DRAFT_816404 [Gloeopeniophorella convolvens]